MKRIAVSFASLILLPLVAAGQIVDFEDVPAEATFAIGDVFASGGVRVHVEHFFLSGSGWIGNDAKVRDASVNPMRTGNVAYVDPANLRFEFGRPLDGLTLHFAEGSPAGRNIEINGDLREVARMHDVHNTVIGGVRATVFGGGPDRTGILELEPVGQPIHDFAIGGYEFFVDNIVPGAPGAFEIYF